MLLAQQKYIFSKFWNSVIKFIKCLRVTDRLAYQSPVPEFVEKNKYATSATDRSVVSHWIPVICKHELLLLFCNLGQKVTRTTETDSFWHVLLAESSLLGSVC